MERLRVFVSSTHDDLVAYREATRKAIAGLELFADDMVSWSADERPAVRLSVDRVAQSDVMILLVAHRYGYVPPGQPLSVTEMEYEAARRHQVPVLAFFLDEGVAWPPDQIEWEARVQLAAFKTRIEAEVTRQVFRSPDDLAAQTSQALSLFSARRREAPRRTEQRFVGPVRREATTGQIRTQPDLLIEIGIAEDGLPLLLDVRRSRDLRRFDRYFTSLARALDDSGVRLPSTRLASFRYAVEQFADQESAREGVVSVEMADGQSQELLVAPVNLTGLFSSALAGLLARPPSTMIPSSTPRAFRSDDQGGWAGHEVTAPPMARMSRKPQASRPPVALQSAGGTNRFLAVSPEHGTVHCVGLQEQKHVEWRPFVFEDVRQLLPSARLKLTAQLNQKVATCSLDAAATALAVWGKTSDSAVVTASSVVHVGRADVLRAIALVADAVQAVHDGGKVHGDLKPPNVLLREGRAVLIDEFGTAVGDPAPGWTPGWSAPEQMIGLPLTPTADVYSLGMMVNSALAGVLVGEVRQYRGLLADDLTMFELFHDPAVVLTDRAGVPEHSAASQAWRTLIEQALRFDPAQRISTAAEFARMLRELIRAHPPGGGLSFVPSGRLVRSRMVGGGDRIARVIDAGWRDGQQKAPENEPEWHYPDTAQVVRGRARIIQR